MDKRSAIRHVTGETQAQVAEAWFMFVGFVLATAVLHAAAETSDNVWLAAIKWVSYFFLYRWLNYKVDLTIWALIPGIHPVEGKWVPWQMATSASISVMLTFGVYVLVYKCIVMLVEAGAV